MCPRRSHAPAVLCRAAEEDTATWRELTIAGFGPGRSPDDLCWRTTNRGVAVVGLEVYSPALAAAAGPVDTSASAVGVRSTSNTFAGAAASVAGSAVEAELLSAGSRVDPAILTAAQSLHDIATLIRDTARRYQDADAAFADQLGPPR